jgi:hypothetical protein
VSPTTTRHFGGFACVANLIGDLLDAVGTTEEQAIVDTVRAKVVTLCRCFRIYRAE